MTEAEVRPENRLSTETTPTWEMELLISGATVFGLLVLPGKLDALFYNLSNRVSADVLGLLMPLWLYAKTSLLTLIGTFVLYLVLRAHWTAMVGLNSVYPGGIHFRGAKMGPLERAVLEAGPSIEARIETADNRATRVFGVGVGLALVMLGPFIVMLGCLLLWLGANALGLPSASKLIIGGVFALLAGPAALAILLDRWLGDRLPASSSGARALKAVLAFYFRLGLLRGSSTLLGLFRSNEGRARTFFLTFLLTIFASAITLGQFAADRGELDIGDFAGLPEDDPGSDDTVYPAHYASLRAEGLTAANPVPFIPDRVVKGPYLELLVPYRARNVAPLLRQECPQDVEAAARDGQPARAALDCLARLLDIRIDGGVEPVRLDASADPVTGTRGVLAMIPVGKLAAGRHLLTLKLPRLQKEGMKPQPPQKIPFWK